MWNQFYDPLYSATLSMFHCPVGVCVILQHAKILSVILRSLTAVYPPVVMDSFPQLHSNHRRPLMNRIVCDERFSVICNTFIRTFCTLTLHQNWSFPPCSNAILANCIYQTNATSGFGPVAHFKISLVEIQQKLTELILNTSCTVSMETITNYENKW